MKQFMILMLVFILGAVSVTAAESTTEFWCNIGIGEVGGEQCISLRLPENPTNTEFCSGLDGQESPAGGTFATSSTEDAECEDVTPVPEFTTIGAGLALAGSIGAYFKTKKNKRK